MYVVFPLSPWLTLALAVPTGALLVRVFIVQHDCGHGSFFASRRANVAGRPAVQPDHAHALRQLGPPARPASRRLEQPRPQRRRRRHLFVLPHGAGVSRAVAVAAPALPPAAPSAGRQPAAAAAGLPAALSRAVRHAARLARERCSVHLTNARPARAVRHAGPAAGLAARSCWSMCRSWWWRRSWASGCSPLQHRFETARWTSRGDWQLRRRGARGLVMVPPAAAAALADRQHRLPSRPPSQSARAQLPAERRPRGRADAAPGPAAHPRARGLAATFLTLWDERRSRLVRFRDAAA